MDKFRIYYRCNREPEAFGLKGFSTEKSYIGRTYNGLYEVSQKWGSGQPTAVIEKRIFDKYFELEQPVIRP